MSHELNDFIQTASVGEIRETLDFLFNECVLDEAPNRETALLWHEILCQRGGKFSQLAQLCTQFVAELESMA